MLLKLQVIGKVFLWMCSQIGMCGGGCSTIFLAWDLLYAVLLLGFVLLPLLVAHILCHDNRNWFVVVPDREMGPRELLKSSSSSFGRAGCWVMN